MTFDLKMGTGVIRIVGKVAMDTARKVKSQKTSSVRRLLQHARSTVK